MKRSCNPTGLAVGTQTVRTDGDCSLSSDSGAAEANKQKYLEKSAPGCV